ncbi:uncharacterized protein AB9W97_009289 isoform 1-T1 [Spinachia spinachia]
MSEVLKEMLRRLQVKQTDGLVERFNQTLKRMLKKVMEIDGKNWAHLLPYVLFGVREVPHASTGFPPLELLYGRRLLDIAKECWESQPSPYRTIIKHVDQMRARVAQVWPVVREHLQQAQQAQARVYNRGAQVCAFLPGERVLVLVPSSDCRYFAKWQGPYEVVTRVNEVNYQAQPVPALAARIPLPEVPMGDHLSPSQLQDLREVVWQHLDFSDLPGRTNMASHDIRTEPRVKVQFDAYPIPSVDELIDRLGTASFISTLDLTKGYWQVPLTTQAREKTAFVTPEGLYQYTVLPFGVQSSSHLPAVNGQDSPAPPMVCRGLYRRHRDPQ